MSNIEKLNWTINVASLLASLGFFVKWRLLLKSNVTNAAKQGPQVYGSAFELLVLLLDKCIICFCYWFVLSLCFWSIREIRLWIYGEQTDIIAFVAITLITTGTLVWDLWLLLRQIRARAKAMSTSKIVVP